MTNPPRPPWFQLHASTVMIMTFAASLLIGLNSIPNCPLQYVAYNYKCLGAMYYGWLASFMWLCNDHPLTLDWVLGLVIDIAFGIAILTIVALPHERYSIHRADRPSPPSTKDY